MHNRMLLALILIWTWLLIPAIVLAQQVPPHIFMGKVYIDGLPAPDGCKVTAVINGEVTGSTTVKNGDYVILVNKGYDNNVGFKVDNEWAEQTATWQQGGADRLDLTTSSMIMETFSQPLKETAINQDNESNSSMATIIAVLLSTAT